MPNIIQRIRDAYADNPATALKLLPELFKAVDDGKIIELPCKYGDIVYLLGGKSFSPFRVCCVSWNCGIERGKEHFQIYLEDDFYDKAYRNFSDIGKTVFLTRESAEAALQEREHHV